jgi:hypothetical protein
MTNKISEPMISDIAEALCVIAKSISEIAGALHRLGEVELNKALAIDNLSIQVREGLGQIESGLIRIADKQ